MQAMQQSNSELEQLKQSLADDSRLQGTQNQLAELEELKQSLMEDKMGILTDNLEGFKSAMKEWVGDVDSELQGWLKHELGELKHLQASGQAKALGEAIDPDQLAEKQESFEKRLRELEDAKKAEEEAFGGNIFDAAMKASGKTEWNRSKLMVVGEGCAGKSVTFASLQGKAFDPEHKSTCGTAVAQLEVDCPRGEELAKRDWKGWNALKQKDKWFKGKIENVGLDERFDIEYDEWLCATANHCLAVRYG
jgi:hypothetical protein